MSTTYIVEIVTDRYTTALHLGYVTARGRRYHWIHTSRGIEVLNVKACLVHAPCMVDAIRAAIAASYAVPEQGDADRTPHGGGLGARDPERSPERPREVGS